MVYKYTWLKLQAQIILDMCDHWYSFIKSLTHMDDFVSMKHSLDTHMPIVGPLNVIVIKGRDKVIKHVQ